jgi:hypothetical protein
VFRGQGADENLPDIANHLVEGKIDLDPTWFWGVNYARRLDEENWLAEVMEHLWIDPEWEVQLTKHEGIQDNFASHLALLLRTHDVTLLSPLLFNVAFGMGPSYAFSKPTYEDGPDGEPNQGEHQLQNYVTFELELGLESLPKWKLATRIHHRSGLYGLIAPRRVGSNFFALGIRYDF